MDKAKVQAALLAALRQELEAAMSAARAATAAATDPDSKAENKYDTRTLEASYIARGQALRVAELQAAVETFAAMGVREFSATQAIAVGALIGVKSGDEISHYFMAPVAGGTEVNIDGAEVMIITHSSPLGQRLNGRKAGESVTLHTGAKAEVMSVL